MSRRTDRGVDATGRSKGEASHVRLYRWVLKSAAHRSLDCYARSLLVELYSLYSGNNNGALFLSVREAAERLNVSRMTAKRALDSLRAWGFIKPRQGGSFEWKERHATSWVLTEFGLADALPTKDFMKWEKPESGSPEGQIRRPEKQNLVLPQGQSGSPQGQTGLPQGQIEATTPSSGSPQGQIRPKTPPICPSGSTQISYQGGGGAGGSVNGAPLSSSAAPNGKRPWSAPSVAEHPVRRVDVSSILMNDLLGLIPRHQQREVTDRCAATIWETGVRPTIAVRINRHGTPDFDYRCSQLYFPIDATALVQVWACNRLRFRKVDVAIVGDSRPPPEG